MMRNVDVDNSYSRFIWWNALAKVNVLQSLRCQSLHTHPLIYVVICGCAFVDDAECIVISFGAVLCRSKL